MNLSQLLASNPSLWLLSSVKNLKLYIRSLLVNLEFSLRKNCYILHYKIVHVLPVLNLVISCAYPKMMANSCYLTYFLLD